MSVISKDEIELNGYKYRIRGPVVGSFVDPFPQQMTIGDVSLDNRLELSSWVINDLRGGIGVEEMDETIDAKKSYWTNCITKHRGHILPPRKATSITSPSSSTTAAIANGTCEADSNWTGGARSNVQKHAGTYSWLLSNAVAQSYQDATTWTNTWRGRAFTVTGWVYNDTDSSNPCLIIDDEIGQTTGNIIATTGAWKFVSVTRVLDAAATRLRVIFNHDTAVNNAYFDDITIYSPVVTTTSMLMANYNGYLYVAMGNTLHKLNAGRTAWTEVGTLPATITALVSSYNNYLFIYQGDGNRYYLLASDVIAVSDSTSANWGFVYDNKLFKVMTTGYAYYSINPESYAPTWTDAGYIEPQLGIRGFDIGRDASGAQVPYCVTKSVLKVYDGSVPEWIDTEVKLPNHPGTSEAATYFNGKLYLGYGLPVKEYYAETGSVTDIGLTERDGLPIEYNGEISKLQGDTGSNLMFACVNSSLVTGTSQSGLYAWDGTGWHCWWTKPKVLIEDCEDAWNEYVHASVTASLDTSDYQVGSGSAKFVIAGTLPATTKFATEAISSKDLSGCSHITFRAKSSINLSAGQMYLLLDDTAACASTIETLSIPALTANTWTKVDIALASPASDTAIISVGLYQATDVGAFSLWIDQIEGVYYDGTMTDCIVSSASSSYAAYFDHAGTVYYIDIPRGMDNPDKITQSYETSGILLTPWFDAGNPTVPKLAKMLASFSKGITTTETVALLYRIDHTNSDMDTGWTTLETLNTTAESGYNEEVFASGAGISFKSIQFRLNFVTPGSTAKPDIQSLVLYYKKRTGSEKLRMWTVKVLLDDYAGSVANSTPKQKVANLKSAINSTTDVIFSYHPSDDSTESYYVSVSCPEFNEQTGRDYQGDYTLNMVES